MLGKPEWFGRRKYGGWGVWPKTWQGLAYLAALIAVYLLIHYLPFGAEKYRIFAYGFVSVLVVADILDIVIRLPLDEREQMYEALAERNALWAILVILGFGLVYRALPVSGAVAVYIDPVIVAAMIAGVAVKAATNIYLDRKD